MYVVVNAGMGWYNSRYCMVCIVGMVYKGTQWNGTSKGVAMQYKATQSRVEQSKAKHGWDGTLKGGWPPPAVCGTAARHQLAAQIPLFSCTAV